MKFYTLGSKQAFVKLRQVFIEALILYHFDPESHIWININTLDYTINEVLSQLTLEKWDR